MSAVACRVMEGPYSAQALDYLARMVNVFEEAKAHPGSVMGTKKPQYGYALAASISMSGTLACNVTSE